MKRPRTASRRSAAVTVETAISLPVLLLLVFGGIEFSRVHTISDTCSNAAFEGARRGIVEGATATDCRNEAQAILNIVGIHDSTITVTPDPLTNQANRVTVRIDVSLDSNSWVLPKYFLGSTLTRTVTLAREVDR